MMVGTIKSLVSGTTFGLISAMSKGVLKYTKT